VVKPQPASSPSTDGIPAPPELSPFLRRGVAATVICSAISAAALLFVAYEVRRRLDGTLTAALGTLGLVAIGGLLAAAAGGAALCLAVLLRRERALAEANHRYRQMLSEPVLKIAAHPLTTMEAESAAGTPVELGGSESAEGRLAHLAHHDQLTGLPNRPLFLDRLAQSLAKARRAQTGVAVLALDVDRFRVINDTHGQAVGDQLLQGIAERLRAMVRSGDTVARFGADELTLMLQFNVRAAEAAKVAQKIVEEIAVAFSFGGEPLRATVSIGVGLYPADGEDVESLLRSADRALLRAKETGGNGYQLCTPAMNARAVARLALESDLRRAVERHELELLYQPVVSFSSGLTVGMEALVRWQHPQRGLVPPAQFIPLAEELRLIVPIGEWVLATACRQARAWHAGVLPGVRMAINLSALHFQDADLPRAIAALLREVDLDPDFLDLEITESAAMQNVEQTIATLGALRRLGVSIAMDDFGTGQASLGYLKRLPIDCLKIDRGFVRDLDGGNGRAGAAIVTAILDMAHGLGLKVIAEGVETEEQYRFLDKQGCDEYQGYLVSKPVRAAEIEQRIGRGLLQRLPS
jgi:diguanylate cyclase (GGDEF)-like protein